MEIITLLTSLLGILAALCFMKAQTMSHNPPMAMSSGSGVVDVLQEPFPITAFARKARPSVGTAPLDVLDNVAHIEDVLNMVVGSVDSALSGLVMGLTGISITDCAASLKGKNLDALTCAQFLDTISQCDSLSNIKPLVQQAKKNLNKRPNSKKPCFQ